MNNCQEQEKAPSRMDVYDLFCALGDFVRHNERDGNVALTLGDLKAAYAKATGGSE